MFSKHNKKSILSLVISIALILLAIFNLLFLYISYSYYSNTQIHRSVNIVTDLSYTFYSNLVNKKIKDNKKNTIYNISKTSANIVYTITRKPKKDLIIQFSDMKINHEVQRKKIQKHVGSQKIIRDISMCYPRYNKCFNLNIQSKSKFYIYYISLSLSVIISIFFTLYIIYSQYLLFSLIKFKKILKMVDHQIKDFLFLTPKNIEIIPKTIFKIILSLKKEIKNRIFTLNAISHDLKTPLTKARLLIENQYSDKSVILKYFDDIDYLFSQIAVYNRKSNKNHKPIKTDIVNFVECLCQEYERFDAVDYSTSIERAFVYIQIKEMKRAFSNIIDNAIKYAGFVNISISNKEDFIKVIFTDTGPGINENELNKIWQPFFRSDIARSSTIPGTGLGLCIVKKILEANNAQISIKNNKPHGLKVTVKFQSISDTI